MALDHLPHNRVFDPMKCVTPITHVTITPELMGTSQNGKLCASLLTWLIVHEWVNYDENHSAEPSSEEKNRVREGEGEGEIDRNGVTENIWSTFILLMNGLSEVEMIAIVRLIFRPKMIIYACGID